MVLEIGSSARRSAGWASSPKSDLAKYNEPWKLAALIVDDTTMDREWVSRQLAASEEFSATITQAASVAEALDHIGRHSFDLALVDYQLPDGHGDAIIRALASQDHSCATVLISGHTMSEVALFGFAAGASAALSKDDLDPALLATTIRFALFNQARRSADGTPAGV